MQLYLSAGKFRDLIMQECHDTWYAGHLGVRKTADLILRNFYWPMVQTDVPTYVATCEECQKNKPSNLTTSWTVAAIGGTWTSLGEDQYGFRDTPAQDKDRV